MPQPPQLLDHLRRVGYHPRSSKHSDALGEAIVADLLAVCPSIAERAARGELTYWLNFDLHYGTAQWNVDLVLGIPPPGVVVVQGQPIVRAQPASVQIALEFKAVMTEHRKAVKNRKRDMEAHHEHVHNYDQQTIAGGVLLINGSETFRSPLRAGAVTKHSNVADKLRHCMSEVRAISVRGGPSGSGLDAMAAIVVNMDNIDLASTGYITASPAPQVGDPLHYDSFIQRICREYRHRFDSRPLS